MIYIYYIYIMKIPFNLISNFIIHTCKKYSIDESHGLKHSMDVFKYSQRIIKNEKIKHPCLINQERVIYTSALLHDMCDNKYMDENDGLNNIREFIDNQLKYDPIEVHAICDIISTMSYSKVKKQGFPEMNEYMLAYHIVREADLLTAYDIDRCIVFNMHHYNVDYIQSVNEACNLYNIRMGKHINDNLFITETGLVLAKKLEEEANERFDELQNII